jgi:hypothetical protein
LRYQVTSDKYFVGGTDNLIIDEKLLDTSISEVFTLL